MNAVEPESVEPSSGWTDVFVRRPVLSTVLSLVLLLLGVISFFRLPIRETPELQPPTVTVTTAWPGADPTIVESDVTEILEREINGIAGIRTMTSTSREQVSQIVVEFLLERDLEEAANDVRARVSRARRRLPEAVEEPIVEKADADTSPVIFMRLAGQDQTLLELSEIADTLVRERLQTVDGVSNVDIYGEQRYAMRIELDPAAMASRGVDLSQVERALATGNVDAPGGRVEGAQVELSVRVDAGLTTPEQFKQLVISEEDNAIIHLGDIGNVRLGAENERSAGRADGLPAITVAVIPQAQANIINISDEVQRRLVTLERDLPPGVTLERTYDRTEAVRSSIREVEETLFIAFGLVVAVIFLFLRDLRSTIIPALAIPVSIIGTFLFLYAFGFSINIFTLFGLVLAIGLVVDDAIVVLENIWRRIERGEAPAHAALHGTRQIVFAILATTVSLVVVFLPIVFTGGTTGRVFMEFGTTVAVAVALSGVVALTLTPMLCSMFLRSVAQGEAGSPPNPPHGFALVDRWFASSLRAWSRMPALAFGVLLLAAVAGVLGYRVLPREFFPTEDRNMFMVRVVAPEGTAFAALDARMRELEPELMDLVPERKVLLSRVATAGGGAIAPANTGLYIVPLTRKEERERPQQQIVSTVARHLSDVTAFLAIPTQPSVLSRGPSSSPLQFVLLHPDFETLAAELPDFVAKMRKVPGLTSVNEDLRLNRPELSVWIDRDRAAAAGIEPRALARTLQVLTSALELSQFKRGNRSYPVLVSLSPEARATPADLERIEVLAKDGSTVPLGNFATFTEQSAASARYHFDRSPSATISANLDGISLGTAIERVQLLADAELPEGFRTTLAGESREFADSNQALALLFVLAVLLVYLTLAAQFDSFLDPVSILVSVPLALAGAFVGLWLFGMTVSFFAQVGLILLVGLVTKNGILIVEYAKQLEHEGLSVWEAAQQSTQIRFRPVVMTSVSTVVGALPIALGFTSTSRAPLGVAVVAGMLFATVLTLYVTPVVYATLASRVRRRAPVAALVLVGVGLAGTPERAQAEPLALGDVLQIVMMSNLDISQQHALVDQVHAARLIALSGALPSLSAEGLTEYGTIQGFGGAPGDTATTMRANARLEVPLLDLPAWYAARAADRRALEALHTELFVQTQILAEAGVRYVELARADQALAEAISLRDRSARLLQLATNRVEVGDAAPIERTRAAVVARQDEQRVIEARLAREAARRQLAEFIGLPLDASLEVVAGPVAGVPGPDVFRADLSSAASAVDAARAERAAAQLGWVPQITGYGTLGYFARSDIQAPSATAGLAAAVPVFTGLGRTGASRRASAVVSAAELRLEDLEREVAVQNAIADDAVTAGREAWTIATEARALAEQEVALAEDRFATGAASNIEVVEAQARLAGAVTSEVAALATYNRALIEAWRARGTLILLSR